MNYWIDAGEYDIDSDNVDASAKINAVIFGMCMCWKGEELSDARIERGGRATALAWHPTRSVIACGWKTGQVTVHEVVSSAAALLSIVEPPDAATLPGIVATAVWTSQGSRLLAGFAVSQPTAS